MGKTLTKKKEYSYPSQPPKLTDTNPNNTIASKGHHTNVPRKNKYISHNNKAQKLVPHIIYFIMKVPPFLQT